MNTTVLRRPWTRPPPLFVPPPHHLARAAAQSQRSPIPVSIRSYIVPLVPHILSLVLLVLLSFTSCLSYCAMGEHSTLTMLMTTCLDIFRSDLFALIR